MIGKFKDYDMTAIKEAQEYARPGAGGYVMRILSVMDVPEKEYLLVKMDIAEGQFADYGKKAEERNHNDWSYFKGYVSYKEYNGEVTWRWNNFIGAVWNSNAGLPPKFNGDEQLFVGKYIGVVLFDEEYIKNDNSLGVRSKVDLYTSAEKIRQGKFKVKPLKTLETASKPVAVNEPAVPLVEDDDLPF